METEKIQTLPPPPGVVGALKSGFDAIASNLSVMILPLVLDIFLWLGPRLQIDQLFKRMFDEMIHYPGISSLSAADVATLQNSYTGFLIQLRQYNLLSVLRTFPIGVFSLMTGKMPTETPFGAPFTIQVDSIVALMGWGLFLTLTGWIIGGIYFRWVSLVVNDPSQSTEDKIYGRFLLHSVLFSLIWSFVLIVVGAPLVGMLTLVAAASPLLAQGILILAGLFAMWLIVPAFFTPHGIFIRQQNAITSMATSLHVARFALPNSSFFVLSVSLIAFGLNFIWDIPSPNSWMLLVGIAGHAFITTSLLAASFIYYQDMQTWLQTVLEKLKANHPAKQV